jgi:hypothetical protein
MWEHDLQICCVVQINVNFLEMCSVDKMVVLEISIFWRGIG